jgi:hypothetical protein
MDLKKEVVTFRDGSKVTVCEENHTIANVLIDLENKTNAELQAEGELAVKEKREPDFTKWGWSVLYNKMAACSTGDVPTLEESEQWPSVEVDKWYAAARRINPQWFKPLDDLKDAEVTKKKGRKRQK